jgi:hypothetical protein
MASLDTLQLTFVETAADRYASVVDDLLRLPVSHAKRKIYQDVRTFLKKVLTYSEDAHFDSELAVSTAVEEALFELYGPPEIQLDEGEFCSQTVEAEDRRRAEFYALVADALGA